MNKEIQIPPIMSNLPVDERGYPIPYFVPIINGKYDFRYSDPKKKEACRKYKKCWICGNRLRAKDFWFITGPLGLKNCTVSDEAMHEKCAWYSLAVCPHLLYEKAERRSDDRYELPSQSPQKPGTIFLIQADKMTFLDSVHTRFRVVQYFPLEYKENKLVFSELFTKL